jgi:predicted permease
MWQVVRHRYAKAGGKPTRLGRLALHVATAADLVWSALLVRIQHARRNGMKTGTGMWKGLGLDARFVGRSLLRSPGYAATAVLVLAAAVAVNTSVFSFVRGTLLRAPTYPEPERVVAVWGSNAVDGQLRDVVSGPNYLDMARETTTLDALAALHSDGAVLLEDGRPNELQALAVSVDFFRVVPVAPARGRLFDDRDRMSGGGAVALVSWAFWRDALGSHPEVVGSALPINGEPHVIVGVLPEDFEFLVPAPIWLPLRDDVLAADGRGNIHYHLFGRLRPGTTAQDATADLTAVQRRIALEYPGYANWTVRVEPLSGVVVEAVRNPIWFVTAAVCMVLLVALVNLATLFRIRTLGRGGELGIRLALGAGWVRVARVLALEAVALAGAGAAVGLLAAPYLLARIRDMVPLWIPIPDSAVRVPALRAMLDPWVAAVAVGLTVAGALALTAPGLVAALRQGGLARRGRDISGMRGTRWLVAVELCLATVLCLGAGLTTRSAAKLLATDVGIRDEGLLQMWVGDVWERPVEDQVTFFRQVAERVEAVPGVESAALIDYVPFKGEDDFARVYFLDQQFQPVNDLREEWRRVTEGLFETAGMPMVRGRSFDADDFRGVPRVAVVNEAFAAKHYPRGDAVGAFLSTHNQAYRDLRIVGVVGDVLSRGPQAPATPILYVPYQGDPRGTMGFYVRVAGRPMAYVDAVREAVWSVDPTTPMTDIAPMTELVGQWVAIPRAVRTLVAGLAGLALVLAVLGVFGVVSYAVRRRTAEFGVRLALGASPLRLGAGVLIGVAPLVATGVGAGLVLGVASARMAGALIFDVPPADPASLAAAVAAMLGAALLAAWLPLRRVGRIDPTEAMRVE